MAEEAGIWVQSPVDLGEDISPPFTSAAPESERQAILLEAMQYVSRDRNTTYGEPEDNFKTIVDLWNVYTNHRASTVRGEFQLNEIDQAIMMCLLKIARIANDQSNRDNYVDLAGYAACAGEVAAKESEVNE